MPALAMKAIGCGWLPRQSIRACCRYGWQSVVLTPNGDGRNDTVGLGYDLLELTGPASVEVAVWDLSGRLVRRVYEGWDGVGAYERVWDGRDALGRLVPPGLYLYRVSVEADHQTVEAVKSLQVAY